jgi:hypothetical protein
MILYYIIFSYLFLIGVYIEVKTPKWNVVLSPLIVPVLLGKWAITLMQYIVRKSTELEN